MTFEIARLELMPIRKFRLFHNRLTREFTTAAVRCRLVKRETIARKIARMDMAAR